MIVALRDNHFVYSRSAKSLNQIFVLRHDRRCMGVNMGKNLENQDAVKKVAFTVEAPPSSGSTITLKNDEPVVDDDDAELDVVEEAEEVEEEQEADLEIDLEAEEEPEVEPEKKPALSKDQRKIKALKAEAIRLASEKAELERKLNEKANSEKADELVQQYLEEGLSEPEAKRKAKDDIRTSAIESELALYRFERANKDVLSKYNPSDSDLQKIMTASKTGVMTVEQICRGLYGGSQTAKEKRAISSLTESGNQQTASVSGALRSSASPVKSALTEQQRKDKVKMMKQFGIKEMTDKQFLEVYPR